MASSAAGACTVSNEARRTSHVLIAPVLWFHDADVRNANLGASVSAHQRDLPAQNQLDGWCERDAGAQAMPAKFTKRAHADYASRTKQGQDKLANVAVNTATSLPNQQTGVVSEPSEHARMRTVSENALLGRFGKTYKRRVGAAFDRLLMVRFGSEISSLT